MRRQITKFHGLLKSTKEVNKKLTRLCGGSTAVRCIKPVENNVIDNNSTTQCDVENYNANQTALGISSKFIRYKGVQAYLKGVQY